MSQRWPLVSGHTAAAAAQNGRIYGGLPIDEPQEGGCTTGFGVIHGESQNKGVSTAGHCGNNMFYSGSSLTFQSEAVGGFHDEQWHIASGFTVKNWINDGVDITFITSRTFVANQALGTFVCKFGRATFAGCGTIAEKNVVGCVQNPAAAFVRISSSSGQDLAAPGDSGGPVYKDNSAYGMISCQAGVGLKDALYVPVDSIEAIGITILTAP